MHSTRRSTLSSFVQFAILGVAISGCGGSDGPTDQPDDTGTIDDTSGFDTTPAPDTGRPDMGVDSSVADADGGGDTTTADATADATDVSSADGSDAGSDAAEGGGSDAADSGDAADVACAPLASGATDVYVDKSSTRASVGTTECPFHTILEASTLAAPATGSRAIHVKGGTGTTKVDYTETASIVVKNNVSLLGDGLAITRILGGGACAEGTGNCTVLVLGGGSCDGFTVGGSGMTTSATGKATVKNTLVTASSGDGIRALGNADFGPNIQSNVNAGNGLTISGSAKVHVIAGTGAINQFDSNTLDGIKIGGTDSVLTFDGGSASSNHGDGLDTSNVPSALTTSAHTVTALVAKLNGFDGTTANGHSGIVVGASAGLKLRTSVVLKNGGIGVFWTHSTAGTSLLDIGSVTGFGGNSFGGPTTADQNAKAGICMVTPPSPTAADGNKWSVCPPTQNEISSECNGTFTYADIAYKKAATTPVITTTSCTVGP